MSLCLSNLNRWYDSNDGRWISEDTIAFKSDETNLIRYVSNSPIRHTDPSGLIKIWFEFNGFINAKDGVPFPALKAQDEQPGTWLLAPDGNFYATDNRGPGGGSSRVYYRGWIESTKLGEVGNSDWGAKKGTSGSTQIGYIVTVDGRPLPSPVFHYATMNATVKASASKYNGRSGNRLGTTIHLQASAHDPFIPIAPNLDFSVDFNFNYDCSKPGKVFVSVNGTHDAFPDYEALITTAPSSLNAPIFGTNIYYARATGSLLLGLLWGYTFASREYVINAPTPAY